MIILQAIAICFAIVMIVFVLSAVRAFFSGAPFVASRLTTVSKIVQLAQARRGMKVADIGSGDGRVCIAFAKAGIEAHGYEINIVLVLWSRLLIRLMGLSGKAHIHWKNYWDENLSEYDVIVVYGIGYIMKSLETKLKKELKIGARVLSLVFRFPGWKVVKQDSPVFLYEVGKK